MSEPRRSGCFLALLVIVALAALGVVAGGLGVGGWYWWSSQEPAGAMVHGGPWTLTVDNPNDEPVSVSCAFESTPPVEVGPKAKARLSITIVPATCTANTADGVRVLDFSADGAPKDAAGWAVSATLRPVDPEKEEAEPEAQPKDTVTTTAVASAPRAEAKDTAKPSTKPKTAEKKAAGTPAEEKPAPVVTSAPLMLRYPGGPKFADIEVSVDGRELGTRPTGTSVSVGSHTVQFYKDGLLNISCPIDVPAGGRVVTLSRKLTCPPPRE